MSQPMSQFTQGHALLIGVGTYQHMSDVNVPITVADAKALRDVLSDATLCGYPTDQINLLQDEATTRTGLLAALDNLAATTKPESTVVLYYAGHGEYGTDGNYYLTTYDSQRQGAKIEAGTGLSDAELITKLRAIPAKRLLLIFNACHAGAISPDLSIVAPTSLGSTAPPEEALDAILSTGEGRIIMTACRPQQKSRIGYGPLTLFTQALVEGFRGQGYVSNNKGYVSAFGLYEHLYATVKDGADALGYQQEPELTVLRGVGPFPVAIYRGASSLGVFDSQEAIPADTAARAVNPERSQRLLKRYISQTTVTAAGERSVAIGGNVSNSPIITGDNNTVRRTNTGGGAYVEGNVDTKGGDFVGRDKKTTSYTAFDQSRQTVLGPQTNIAGDVNTSGGIFNSGNMNTGAPSSRADLLAELRKLLAAITQAGAQGILDEDSTIDASGAVQKAINQADKANPDRQAMRKHLTTAKVFIEPIPAASGLVAAINAVSGLLT